MLALSSASCSYAMPNRGMTMPNPIKSAALFVTELSTVGFDRPARTAQLQEFEKSLTAPLRAVQRTKERVANHICMTVSATEGRVGDFGFDPLGLGNDENFASMREAEIKHGRLAMLAALAWPLQEILHPVIVDNLYALYHVTVPDVLLESNGASPSLLNGGLEQSEVLPALFLALIGASVIEETDIRSAPPSASRATSTLRAAPRATWASTRSRSTRRSRRGARGACRSASCATGAWRCSPC